MAKLTFHQLIEAWITDPRISSEKLYSKDLKRYNVEIHPNHIIASISRKYPSKICIEIDRSAKDIIVYEDALYSIFSNTDAYNGWNVYVISHTTVYTPHGYYGDDYFAINSVINRYPKHRINIKLLYSYANTMLDIQDICHEYMFNTVRTNPWRYNMNTNVNMAINKYSRHDSTIASIIKKLDKRILMIILPFMTYHRNRYVTTLAAIITANDNPNYINKCKYISIIRNAVNTFKKVYRIDVHTNPRYKDIFKAMKELRSDGGDSTITSVCNLYNDMVIKRIDFNITNEILNGSRVLPLKYDVINEVLRKHMHIGDYISIPARIKEHTSDELIDVLNINNHRYLFTDVTDNESSDAYGYQDKLYYITAIVWKDDNLYAIINHHFAVPIVSDAFIHNMKVRLEEDRIAVNKPTNK